MELLAGSLLSYWIMDMIGFVVVVVIFFVSVASRPATLCLEWYVFVVSELQGPNCTEVPAKTNNLL